MGDSDRSAGTAPVVFSQPRSSGTGLPAPQGYAYDANNNRTSTTLDSSINGFTTTGGNNQLSSNGTYGYAYDANGNLITKTTISTGETQNFAWDYRNRLTDITYKDSRGTTTKHIHYTYDVFNRRIGQSIDSAGTGTYDKVERLCLRRKQSGDDAGRLGWRDARLPQRPCRQSSSCR